MSKNNWLLLLIISSLFVSCVQQAHQKTIVIKLTVKNRQGIKSVGIRGNDKPLSWETDFPMQVLVPDAVYTANVTSLTGYRFTELKFTVNGEWELQNKPNRKIMYSANRDTVFYNARFNEE